MRFSDALFWTCAVFCALTMSNCQHAMAAPIVVGVNVSGWNVKTPSNPGGYTESPYLADGVTESPQAQDKLNRLAPYGGFIRFMDAMQTVGSAQTSPANRSTNNLSPAGITWEGIAAMANLHHASPWVNIPQGAIVDPSNVKGSYAYQLGASLAQHLDPRIPNVYVEYSNELWNGGDQLQGTQNLFRARADPTLTATGDTQRMAQEAGREWARQKMALAQGFKDAGGKAKVVGVFGGFIANQYWASDALTFAKATVPGLDLSQDRIAVAPYAPGAPSDIGGIHAGDTAASIISRSQNVASTYFPAWIGSNKSVADYFGMKGLAFYETMGGATYDYTSGSSLMADANRSAPEMRSFENWLFTFVSDLADGKLDGKNTDPGALESIFGSAGIPYNNINQFAPWEFYESPDSPKALGILDFVGANAANVDPFAVPEPAALSLLAVAFMMARRYGKVLPQS